MRRWTQLRVGLVGTLVLIAMMMPGCGGSGTDSGGGLTGRWVASLTDPAGYLLMLDLEQSGPLVDGQGVMAPQTGDGMHAAYVFGTADSLGVDLRYSFIRAGDTSFSAGGEFIGARSGDTLTGIAIDGDTEDVTPVSFTLLSASAKSRADGTVGGYAISFQGYTLTLSDATPVYQGQAYRYKGTFTCSPVLFDGITSGTYQIGAYGAKKWQLILNPTGNLRTQLFNGTLEGTPDDMVRRGYAAQDTAPHLDPTSVFKLPNGKMAKVGPGTIARP